MDARVKPRHNGGAMKSPPPYTDPHPIPRCARIDLPLSGEGRKKSGIESRRIIVGAARVGQHFPERRAKIHDVLLLAMFAAVAPHVVARKRGPLHQDHFPAACGALRQRRYRRRFAAEAEFEPEGPLHLRFDPRWSK
jgi:hypothetical protein